MIDNGFELAPEAVYELIGAIYRSSDAFASDFDEQYPTVESLRQHLAILQQQPGNVLLVSSIGKKRLGFIHIEPRGPQKLRHTAELAIGVSPEARGLGIGKQLLDAAIEQLAEEGVIEILYLEVRADNASAIRLYERCGFERLALLERDTRIGDQYYDGLLMRRFITRNQGAAIA